MFGLTGVEGESRRILEGFEAARSAGQYVDPYNVALVQMGLADRSAALTELERCADDGSMQNWIMAPEPFFDPLRTEPRFREVLRRLDLPQWTPPPK